MAKDLATELNEAIEACNQLSRNAKAAGDMPTMYKANEAWHALFDASNDLARRRNALKAAG